MIEKDAVLLIFMLIRRSKIELKRGPVKNWASAAPLGTKSFCLIFDSWEATPKFRSHIINNLRSKKTFYS
jgi:hypothetical protein